MERTTWTDERLDDLNGRINRGFDRVDARFDRIDVKFDRVEARVEARFDRIDSRFDSLDAALRIEIDALRQMTVRLGGGILIALVGVLATLFARGF